MRPDLLPPFGSVEGEVVRAGLVLATFAALTAIAEVWHHRAHPPAEWTRKLLHFSFGMVAMGFPWLFASHWTLLAVVVLGGGPILWARAHGRLPSLFGIERGSRGEVYFPIAVYALFVLAHHRPVFYLISLCTLVVCDALAAVLGQAYGRHQYLVVSDRRSLEGSAVFLFTAFLCVEIPLLLMTDLDRAVCVLIAAQIALLVTSFEAIGSGGIDNLLVPLGTYYLLVKITPHSVGHTAFQLAVQIGILAAMFAIARATRFLSFSGAVAAHLMLYAAFGLGGPTWIVAPALALAAAIVIENAFASAPGVPRGGYHVRVIYYVSVVAVLLIFADNTFATLVEGPHGLSTGHPFHTAFVGSLAAALAIITYWTFEVMPRVRRRPAVQRALASAALGYTVVAPLGLWAERGHRAGREFAIAAILCITALLLFIAARRLFRWQPGSIWDLRALALSVLAATAAVLPLHFLWIGVRDWRRG